MTAALIGIDIGTTAVKAAAYGLDGRRLASARVPYPTARPGPGLVEQDPDDWIGGLVDAWHQLEAATPLEPLAYGLCSQVNTHVFVDAAGAALGPALVWQDIRCAEVAAELDAGLTDARRQELWGGPFTVDASFALSRAAWLARTRPADWAATRSLRSPKDHCLAALTGEVVTDPRSPVGLVGADGRYLAGVTALVDGAAERLPPIAPATVVAGTTRHPDLPAGVPVAVGTMDAWSSLYGSGVSRAGQGMQVAGTSEIIGVLSDASVPTPGVISFAPEGGLHLHAGPTQAGGDALRWWAEAARLGMDEALAEAAQGLADRRDVVFLPHLEGERAPLWNADARAVWLGVTADCDRRHLGAAVLEGVACAARQLLEAAEAAAGRPVEELRLSGGAAASDRWCQVKADIHGRPLARLENLDTGTFGAALLGGVAVGAYPDPAAAADTVVRVERAFEPDPTARDRADHLYGVYRAAYEALVPVFTRLAGGPPR